MTTVMDHASPWLTPSRTLAATIHSQLGATRDQQRDGQRDRPAGDEQPPAAEPRGEAPGAEVGQRLGEPEGDDERQHRGLGGRAEVLAADQRQRRALQADHRADERVDRDQERELRGVLAQPELDAARGHDVARERPPGAVGGQDLGLLLGRRRDVLDERGDERVLGVERSARLWRALEADGRDRVGREPAAADRAGVVRRDTARRGRAA